jgi:hypothetical protein
VAIYAPVGRTETATMTKVWWHEVDDAFERDRRLGARSSHPLG